METKTIYTNNGEKKSEMSNGQAAATAGIAGAAAGVGAFAAYDAYADSVDPIPGEPVDPTPNDPVDPTPNNPANPTPNNPVEPTPVDPVEPTPVDPVEPTPNDTIDPTKTEDQPFTDPEQPDQDAVDPATEEVIAQNEDVDVDQIADDIIAIEEVDPNDIDMEDVLTFMEIGEIYTEDGDVYNASLLVDAMGDEYVLVDIDGDLYYDILTDEDFNVIAEVDNLLSEDDAESQIAGELAELEADDVTTEAINEMDFTGDITT